MTLAARDTGALSAQQQVTHDTVSTSASIDNGSRR